MEGREATDYDPTTPRMARWDPRSSGIVGPYRTSLDRLTVGHVHWTPFDDHQEHHPYEERALYNGFIRCFSTHVRYLPERVLRQFGYMQYIPPSPPIFVTVEDVDDMWAHWEDHVLDDIDLTPVGDDPGECMDGYRSWFIRVSHPYMTAAAYFFFILRR